MVGDVGYHPPRTDAAEAFVVPVLPHTVPVVGLRVGGTAGTAAMAGSTGPAGPAGSPEPAPPRRTSGAPLPTLGGDFLSAAVDLLCRERPLSRAEIGDHADVVAEVADALASVANRLSQDLAALGPDAGGPAGDELARARDTLQAGSAQSRRGAASLWTEHIARLREQVELARGVEPTPEVAPVRERRVATPS